MASEVRIVKDNFSEIVNSIRADGAKLVADTANEIEAEVKAKWGMHQFASKTPVRTRNRSKGRLALVEIVVGSRKRWHGLYHEFGSVFMNPNPAMRPAVERRRGSFMAEARSIVRRHQ